MTKKLDKAQRKDVNLEVHISTGLYHWGDELELLQEQTTQISFYITAMNWFMETLSQLVENVENYEKAEKPERFDYHYRTNSKYLLQVVNGLANQITEYASEIAHVGRELEKTKKEVPNILDLSSQTTSEDDCIDLAKHLSAILNNPRTPEVIKANIKNGLSDLYQPSQFMTTPEYIAEMLCDEANQNTEVAE